MGNQQNDFESEQRRRNIGPRPDMRGTMETVGIEQHEAESRLSQLQPVVINILAVIGALAIIYLILSVLF